MCREEESMSVSTDYDNSTGQSHLEYCNTTDCVQDIAEVTTRQRTDSNETWHANRYCSWPERTNFWPLPNQEMVCKTGKIFHRTFGLTLQCRHRSNEYTTRYNDSKINVFGSFTVYEELTGKDRWLVASPVWWFHGSTWCPRGTARV